jgi:hypothetical protein
LLEGAFVQDKGEVESSGITTFSHAEPTLGVSFVAVRVDRGLESQKFVGEEDQCASRDAEAILKRDLKYQGQHFSAYSTPTRSSRDLHADSPIKLHDANGSQGLANPVSPVLGMWSNDIDLILTTDLG